MRRTTLSTLATLAATTTLALLAGCGGGGGGSPPAAGNGGSVAASALAFGTITRFGSVWVNGTEYDTSAASFRIDDSAASQSDLRVGMVVRIDGSPDVGSASAVTVDGTLKGRVEGVLDANRMLVMGQTVQIDDQTRFENGIVPVMGDFVEVHGLVAGAGVIAAGFVERKASPPSPAFAVKGLVGNHDVTAMSFTVGALVVKYAAATAVNDMPSGLWNGLQVEVKGTACTGNPVCGTLVASKVERGGFHTEDSARTEFEGFVTSSTANGFMLGAQAVVIGAGTIYEGGVAADIVVGTKLEVEGSLAGGVLTARKVSLRDNVRLEGNVASIDTVKGSFTLSGIAGVTIGVNALTELKSLGSLTSLGLSNHVRLKGRAGSNGNTVNAIELELRSTAPDSQVVLQGPVATISGTRDVSILGIVVDTSGVSESEFKGHDDGSIGRAAFFAAIEIGSVVKARGKLVGEASVAWDEMELQE
jgi:hypothetical protein